MKLKLTLVLILFLNIQGYNQPFKQFLNPPDEYRPWIFWDWINDMVTKKGITSDLQEFKKFGVRGTLIMLVGSETSDRQMWSDHHMPNPIISQTPAFFDAWKFAAEESNRLGLTISTQCGPGWCHSGGPWIKPNEAVQHIAYTELQLATKKNKKVSFLIDDKTTGEATAFHSEITDENTPKWVEFDLKKICDINSVRLHPFNNRGVEGFGFPSKFKIEIASKSDLSDMQLFYKNDTSQLFTYKKTIVIKGKSIKGRYVRFTSEDNYSVIRGGKKQYLLSLEELEIVSNNNNIALNADLKSSKSIELYGYSLKAINDGFSMTTLLQSKSNEYVLIRPGYQHFTEDIAVVAFPDKAVIDPNDIIDLAKIKKNGKIEWRAPGGNWIIRRYAIRNALAYNRPAPTGGKGFECDKLDKGAVDAMFAGMVGKYLQDSPNLAGKTIKAFEADSWEVGNPEWSAKFKDEFMKRRGYDPTPWLITFKTNKIVVSPDLTERFKNDMYLTQTDLFADNFFTHLAKKADSLGMEFMTEPYTAPFDPIRMAGRVQVPMCEFWVSTEMMHTARWASSAANTYGHNRVAAEAFTGRWNDGNWKMDPYAIKRVGDLAFCNGVNKMVLHGTALQPWGNDLKPGMNMFFWGTMFVPGQTWWESGRGWVDYITRCQYMLSQGNNVADVVGLMPTLNWTEAMPMGLHKKYNYDLVTEELFLRDMDYENGYFHLPSGAKYKILFLPKTNGKMAPEIITKLIELVKKGGTVVCEDKPTQSPSLTNFPKTDVMVRSLTNELWGDIDGKTVFENKLGNGKMIWMNRIWNDEYDPERNYFLETRNKGNEFWGKPALTTHWSTEFLNLMKSFDSPDVEVLKAGGTAMPWGGMPEITVGTREGEDAIAWIHRKDGETDYYFVSNQVGTSYEGEVSFRIKDKIPFIMDAQTGSTYRIKTWSQQGDRIKISVPFNSFGSVFVIFKPKDQLLTVSGYYNIQSKVNETIPVNDKWMVTFPEKTGAPAIAELPTGSLTNSDIFGIKYFSGTASYKTLINVTENQLKSEVILDLGTVRNLAEIIINDRPVETLWCPPFISMISKFLVPGKNEITVKVTNTWWNRMVGDQQLPEDLEWRENLVFAGKDYKGYELKEFPRWVWTGEQRPSKERVTFTPWRFVEKNSPLQEAGLIGPVQLLITEKSN